MSNIDSNYVDFLLNSLVNNNTNLNNVSSVNTSSQAEEVEKFEQVFDDAIDMLDIGMESINKKDNDEDSDGVSTNSFMQLLGNNFGPPAGLEVENFDYSLIQ